MLTLANLVKKGYLPRELIPPLTTEKLSDSLQSNSLCLTNIKGDKGSSKCGYFSIPRLKEFRRTLEIPHPLFQLKLSKTIAENWSEIDEYFSRSTISLSRPIVKKDSDRAIDSFTPFHEIKSERILRSTASKYLLRTDISRFYDSIYTHSIPWALHTKSVAKTKRRDRSLLGNRIDEEVRNLQDGQTIGIPIGPDTSRIISEIIATAIDLELETQLPHLTGIRHIDDFYLYFKSISDLEQGYSKLLSILQDFELELNPAKVEKIELPETFERRWLSEIRDFRFRHKKSEQRNSLVSFFNLAFQNVKDFPDDYVLEYSIAKASKQPILKQNWDVFEALVLKTMMVEPRVLPFALEIFLRYQKKGFSIDLPKIKETIFTILLEHSRLNHSFEVSWSLWLCRSLKISLSRQVSELISQIIDPIVALVAMDLESCGLTEAVIDKGIWKSIANLEALYNEHWLLVYEANVKGWINSNGDDVVNSDPFFSELRKRNVEFYDGSKQLEMVKMFIQSEPVPEDEEQ